MTIPSDSTVLVALIAFRLLNALVVRTFFQPDEFYQSLEPAWQLAFGQGQGAWLTWVSLFLVSGGGYDILTAIRNGETNCARRCIRCSLLPSIAWLICSP